MQGEKRRQKKGRSTYSDGMSSASGSRQLGPREIKRRPLPPGPGQTQSNDPPALNIPTRLSQQLPPQPNAYPQHQQHQNQQWMAPETPPDFAYRQPPSQQEQYRSPHGSYEDFHDYNDQYEDTYLEQREDSFMPMYESQAAPLPPTNYNDLQYGGSPHSHPSSPYTPQQSSPPVRQSPPSAPQDAYRDSRLSQSPTKYMPYRDSPLRQSVSQQEVPLPPAPFEEDFEEIVPPPPPPVHRGSFPRAGGPTPFSTPPQDRQRQVPPRQSSIDDRSPLQMIEHQYNPHSPSSNRSSGQRLSHLSQDQFRDRPMPSPPADLEIAGDFPAPHQLTQTYGVDLSEPIEQDRRGRYVRRNSAIESPDLQRPSGFDAPEVFDERNTFRSEPRLVKPRAVSPNPGPAIPRKSVSPHPYSSNDRTRMSGVPFGPDSYEMLNPGSSPVSHGHPTPEHNPEAARQTEVNKIRDQGPIIGNDGRVIDPSDHLPADTWAPEPERKTRKPEHVIHVRRRNDLQQRPDSSPLPVKPHSTSNTSYRGLPPMPTNTFSASNSPYQSPVESPSAPQSGRRNRLQKQMPQRPLPTQPFAHPHSSPGSIPQVGFHPQSSPHQQRNSMPSTPMSGPPRPSLSEYQVPVVGNYNPRNSYHPQQHQATPPRMPPMPQRPQSFAYGGGDPLASEMSMIDLGPPRSGGRTGLRSNRGYNGY